MIRTVSAQSWLWAMSVGALLTLGCATSPFRAPSTELDPGAKRAAQHEEMLKQFEARRDAAQFLAAMDRWRDGDPFTCEAQLRSLVTRNPDHLEGRRALADLALERGDVAQAETELRSLLVSAPDDAHTHHSLGLLLDMTGRSTEAKPHLARAAELSPDNTFFQLCAQEIASTPETAVATQPPSAPAAPLVQR